MKTITNGVDVKRVDDKTADVLVKQGWKFCAKSVWKEKSGTKTKKGGKS